MFNNKSLPVQESKTPAGISKRKQNFCLGEEAQSKRMVSNDITILLY